MLEEARKKPSRHSFHSLPRSRLNSMDRLEKYSLLLLKERQVVEISEKAERLAAKCFTTLTENEAFDVDDNTRANIYGTLPRHTRRNTLEGIPLSRSNTFSRPSLFNSGLFPDTSLRQRRISHNSFFSNQPKAPLVQWKDRPHSDVITNRFKEAKERQNLRRERVKSLEEDCLQAKKIILQMKAISMPSLQESQSNSRWSRRSSSLEPEHNGLPLNHLKPCEVDIIDC